MRMNQDRLMREVTGTSKNAGIEEIGVFYAPPIDFGRPVSTAGLPEGEEYAASDEWFSNADLETHFSEESRITALLPQGHAKNIYGAVAKAGEGRWVLDSRDEPAVLVIQTASYDLVLWGQSGAVRAFAVRPSK